MFQFNTLLVAVSLLVLFVRDGELRDWHLKDLKSVKRIQITANGSNDVLWSIRGDDTIAITTGNNENVHGFALSMLALQNIWEQIKLNNSNNCFYYSNNADEYMLDEHYENKKLRIRKNYLLLTPDQNLDIGDDRTVPIVLYKVDDEGEIKQDVAGKNFKGVVVNVL